LDFVPNEGGILPRSRNSLEQRTLSGALAMAKEEFFLS
jgi:hypothetical protein